MSIRTKLQNKEHVIEALRRVKFKFPGRQKIHISKKWGFTKFNADEFEDKVAGGEASHPRWLRSQVHPRTWPPGQVASPAFLRTLLAEKK